MPDTRETNRRRALLRTACAAQVVVALRRSLPACAAIAVLTVASVGTAAPNGDGKGRVDKAAPSAPSALSVNESTRTSVTLSWAPSKDNVAVVGYRISVGNERVGESADPMYMVSGLACATSYTVGVSAYDAAGNESNTAAVVVATRSCSDEPPPTADTQPPTAPTGVTPSSTATSISLAWAASADNVGVAGYDVFRDDVKVGSTASSAYTFGGLACGSSYKLGVAAYDAAGNRSEQGTVNVSTTACSTSPQYPASYFTGPLGARNILPPKIGAFVGLAPQGTWAEKQAQIASREAAIGRKLDIIHVIRGAAPAGTCAAPSPQGYEQWVVDHGSIPLVSWTHGWTLDEVNAGQADACLRDVGQRYGSWGRTVLLRPYWEFNGTWFRWSGTGAKFIAAWKRTVDVMRSAGATNVGFVWCPEEGNWPGTVESYPGDAYVDWVCSDKYNWNRSTAYCLGADGRWHAGWCEFNELFHDGSSIHDLFGPRKPYMVGEYGTVEDAALSGRKGQWHRNSARDIKATFPNLEALVYFDVRWDGMSWPLDTSASSLDGWRSLAQDTYFNTR